MLYIGTWWSGNEPDSGQEHQIGHSKDPSGPLIQNMSQNGTEKDMGKTDLGQAYVRDAQGW